MAYEKGLVATLAELETSTKASLRATSSNS